MLVGEQTLPAVRSLTMPMGSSCSHLSSSGDLRPRPHDRAGSVRSWLVSKRGGVWYSADWLLLSYAAAPAKPKSKLRAGERAGLKKAHRNYGNYLLCSWLGRMASAIIIAEAGSKVDRSTGRQAGGQGISKGTRTESDERMNGSQPLIRAHDMQRYMYVHIIVHVR